MFRVFGCWWQAPNFFITKYEFVPQLSIPSCANSKYLPSFTHTKPPITVIFSIFSSVFLQFFRQTIPLFEKKIHEGKPSSLNNFSVLKLFQLQTHLNKKIIVSVEFLHSKRDHRKVACFLLLFLVYKIQNRVCEQIRKHLIGQYKWRNLNLISTGFGGYRFGACCYYMRGTRRGRGGKINMKALGLRGPWEKGNGKIY